jgi:2-polyprenyl-3-methyl-5-hydroxy-6-metoxy-1,4-benzoquinol methylase
MSTDKSEQATYYDDRFRGVRRAGLLALERTTSILDAILSTRLEGPRIVDLGCGPGCLTNILATFGPTVGVDFSPTAISDARTRYPTVDYESADIFKWNYQRGAFDIVVSQEVLEHVEDQPRYVEIAHDLLRDGGYLILTTPNAETMMAMTERQRKEWTDQPLENWVTRSELRTLLRRRFKILRITTIIHGMGARRSYRVANSPKVQALMSGVGLGESFRRLRGRFGYGLHLVAVARKV